MDELTDIDGFERLKRSKITYSKPEIRELREEDKKPVRRKEDDDNDREQEIVEVPVDPITLLEPRKELNDTIVNWYLSSLYEKQSTKIHSKVHIFNSFFYTGLSRVYRNINGEPSPKNPDKILRWDKEVKIFSKDFLIVPVCHRHHWFLIFICYPRRVPIELDDDEPKVLQTKLSPGIKILARKIKEPCFIFLDSLSGGMGSSVLARPLRKFLSKRWSRIEKPGEKTPLFSEPSVFRTYYARVPKQTNGYDCGVYLLHFVEMFLRNIDENFARMRSQEDLSMVWNIDAREKRLALKAAFQERPVTID